MEMAAEIMAEDKLLGTPFAGESGLELEIAADQMDKLLAHLNKFIIMDDVELVPLGEEQVGEAGSETAIGLSGPLAPEVLERVGLPVIASAMAGTSVEWNGWEVRILRGYGLLAPHYEFWLPSAGLAKLWSCLRTGGATPVGCGVARGVSHCRGDSGVRHRYGGARPAAGDGADAGAALQQGLLPGPGDCGAHPVAGQRAPASAAAGADGACAGKRHGIDAGRWDGCGNDYQRGGAAAEEGRAGVCTGHDARGGGGEEPELPVQGRRNGGNGEHTGCAAQARS